MSNILVFESFIPTDFILISKFLGMLTFPKKMACAFSILSMDYFQIPKKSQKTKD